MLGESCLCGDGQGTKNFSAGYFWRFRGLFLEEARLRTFLATPRNMEDEMSRVQVLIGSPEFFLL